MMAAQLKNNPDAGNFIRRNFTVPDFRVVERRDEGQDDDGIRTIEGHAAVFDKTTNIGNWFTESIARSAFDNCDFSDVLFFVNHDDSKIPLARSRNNNANSTMQISVDEIGLKVRASIDTENNAEARALFSAIMRHDITGMSFAFQVKEQEWTDLDTDLPHRNITSIKKVYDTSAVNSPAYEDTDINARDKAALESAKKALESARSRELESSEKADIDLLKLKINVLSKV